MWRGDLVRIIREIEPRVRFYGSVQEGLNAGMTLVLECRCPDCMIDGPQIGLCAMPENWVPEMTVIKNGHIKMRGWRAILRILKEKRHRGKKLINQARFKKVLAKHGISENNLKQWKVLESQEGNYYEQKD